MVLVLFKKNIVVVACVFGLYGGGCSNSCQLEVLGGSQMAEKSKNKSESFDLKGRAEPARHHQPDLSRNISFQGSCTVSESDNC